MIMTIIYSFMLLMFSMLNFTMWLNFILFNKIYIFEWTIYMLNSFKFNMFILIDDYSLIFMMMVSLISSMVILYSLEYMNLKKYLFKQFFYLVFLFIMSMFIMICSPSILSILLGWDGLGLISYCLIIYYQNFKAYNAGMLTVILNRIGDSSLLMLIILNFMMNLSFNLILYKMNKLMLIMMMIMAMTKSAQLPFSSWLPAAMMAPTPVSSLVHSSTLVTAGVYLIIRYMNLIELNLYNNNLLMISSLTMMFSGLIANFECDFKKIIALSTLSQLGFMMSILSMNFYDLTFLHLLIHAMFKSLMFLCAGSFIHYLNSTQDLRNYSKMMYIFPMKSLIFLFSSLCLCGFPFMASFYSKDLIIENFFFFKTNLFSLLNLMLGTMFSVSYSMRLMLILFFNNYPNMYTFYIKENKFMNYYMMFLMILTLFFSKFYLNLKFLNYNYNLSIFYKLIVMKLCLLGLILGYQFFKIMINKKINIFGMFMKEMLFLNNFYKINYVKILLYMMNYENLFNKSLYMIFNYKFYMFNFKLMNLTMKNLNFFNFYKMSLILIMIMITMIYLNSLYSV
uniref:NADH-ubiquinone oxidoreductase chain 5 n=1 Tax=Nomada flavoguttata TaxID=601529 RepID=A0A0S2LSP8_9HYME|nr:NADH dehydrogenase subunit 5 [Nomada flavoguttata]